jgi:hypothetical protein
MAMEDAWVLAEILHSTADVASALGLFVGRRSPRVNWVQQESRAVGEALRLPPEHPQHDLAGTRREDAAPPVPTSDLASLAARNAGPFSRTR